MSGAAGSFGDAGASGATGTSGAAGTSDGGPDGGPACSSNAECGDAYCVQGACRPCTDPLVACASIDPTNPICRPETRRCAPCAEHAECATGACRIATGECFPTENRLWVSAAANCQAATGSEQAPFCTVGQALDTVWRQPGTAPWAVFVAGSATPYALPPDAGLPERPFALVGPERGLSVQLVGSPPSQLRVFVAGVDRYLARVTVGHEDVDGTVVDCTSGNLWISDVALFSGTRGLRVGCDVRMRRSRITEAREWGARVEEYGRLTVVESEFRSNAGGLETAGVTLLQRSRVVDNYLLGGISVPLGSLSLSNVVMLNNVYAIGHIDLGQSAVATLSYVVALGEALSCASAASSYAIKNSIVPNITCTGQVAVERSLVGPGRQGLGTGNVAVSPTEYEQIFVNHSQGNVHVRPDPPAYLLGVASRSATDLAVDFDGDTRPAVGRPDYPGVDAAPP
jgi:hypothetical protein